MQSITASQTPGFLNFKFKTIYMRLNVSLESSGIGIKLRSIICRFFVLQNVNVKLPSVLIRLCEQTMLSQCSANISDNYFPFLVDSSLKKLTSVITSKFPLRFVNTHHLDASVYSQNPFFHGITICHQLDETNDEMF